MGGRITFADHGRSGIPVEPPCRSVVGPNERWSPVVVALIMVGGAGSANVMRDIQADNTVLKATVIYPSTQAADGIRLARLVVQDEALGDLVEVEVPREIKLYAPVVTKENVEQYLPSAFES